MIKNGLVPNTPLQTSFAKPLELTAKKFTLVPVSNPVVPDSSCGESVMDLSVVFGQYAFREIEMNEVPCETTLRGRTVRGVRVSPQNENDPVLAEMRKAAADHNMSVRFFWPGSESLRDSRSDRINVGIMKYDDGKWRIAERFHIG